MVIYEWADVKYLGKITTPVDDEIDLPVSSVQKWRVHISQPPL